MSKGLVLLLMLGYLGGCTSQNDVETVRFAYFEGTLPTPFQRIQTDSSLLLIDHQDTLHLQEGLGQEWPFKYTMMGLLDTSQFDGATYLLHLDSFPAFYRGYRIQYVQTPPLILRMAYPDTTTRKGWTYIQVQNRHNGQTLLLSGKDLTPSGIRAATTFSQSLQYHSQDSVEIIRIGGIRG